MDRKLRKLSEELVDRAHGNSLFMENRTLVQHYVREHKPLPDRCKPGWLIRTLPEDKRELVKELKAEHFQHRQDC